MTRKSAKRQFSNVIGFDDGPFPVGHTGSVTVVGTVYARLQLNGVLVGAVEKDGLDGAKSLVTLVKESKFAQNVQLIMLQGIALAGFNVVDVFYIYEQLELPILVVSRRPPDMTTIRDALLTKIRGGSEKWAVIERLGPMEAVRRVYVQRVGLALEQVFQAKDGSHLIDPFLNF
jgi:endonuclease V-like protein UPF0215 family